MLMVIGEAGNAFLSEASKEFMLAIHLVKFSMSLSSPCWLEASLLYTIVSAWLGLAPAMKLLFSNTESRKRLPDSVFKSGTSITLQPVRLIGTKGN